MKKRANPAGQSRASRRIKCACASCTCTVDMDKGVRKGNMVYCGKVCMTQCTPNQCMCEHTHCSIP